MNGFILKIITPFGEVFSGEVLSVTVKTDEGDVQILRGHAEYIATISPSTAKFQLTDKTEKIGAIGTGFISTDGKETVIAASSFEYRENIDVERAEVARDKAESMLRTAKDNDTIHLAKARLSRALNRINTAGK